MLINLTRKKFNKGEKTMTKKNLFWVPFLFYLYRDIHRTYKVKVQTIFTPLVTQSLYLLIFGVSLGKVVHISDQFSYLQFIIPGLVALVALNQPFANGSSSVFTMKITGEIIDIRSTVLTPLQVIIATGFSGVVRGVVVSFLTLLVGEIFHYMYEGSWLAIGNIYWLTLFIVLAGFCFSILGLSVGMASRTFDHIGAINGFVVTPLIYLGGVFFDLEKLSPFWQKVSLLNPLCYFVNGIRYAFLGVSDISVLNCLFFIIFSLFGFIGISYYFVSKPRYQRQI